MNKNRFFFIEFIKALIYFKIIYIFCEESHIKVIMILKIIFCCSYHFIFFVYVPTIYYLLISQFLQIMKLKFTNFTYYLLSLLLFLTPLTFSYLLEFTSCLWKNYFWFMSPFFWWFFSVMKNKLISMR